MPNFVPGGIPKRERHFGICHPRAPCISHFQDALQRLAHLPVLAVDGLALEVRLPVTLLQGERQNLEARPTENSDAYDAYLHGEAISIGQVAAAAAPWPGNVLAGRVAAL